MATTVWTGGGQNIAQQATLTVDAVATGGVLTAIKNGKSVSYTILSTDTTTTLGAAGWLAALQASTVPPEFTEITWSVSANVITATAKEPGTPFTLTKSQSGGATCTLVATRANTSRSDPANANNWLRNLVASLPQSGDDVVLANSDVPILWNLDTALASITIASWTRYQSYTGSVGLPEINALGYVEYRPTYLKLASSVNPALGAFPLTLGPGAGAGPTRERYDVQGYRTNLVVTGSGQAADAYAVRFLGSHGQNTVTVVGTSVAVAMLPTEVFPNGATINTATVDGGGTLDCGPGCAFSGTAGGGTLTLTNGASTLFCTPSVTARNNSTLTLSAKDGTYAAVSAINGVQVTITAPMTISGLTVQKSSTVDASGSLGAVTVTTCAIDGDTCQINDPNNVITYTARPTVSGQVTAGPFVVTGPRTMP